MPSTIHLHRVFTAPPDKLYRAFLEADAIASWLPPNGYTCTVHELDARVGGAHRMSFRNFTTGDSHGFGGTYLELVPGRRLVYTDRFDDPALPGELKVTVDLTAVSVGTEVRIEQQGIPDPIPPEACHLGWQECLRKLAKLVEPDLQQAP
ncbi:polyketide cyclase [Comamonas serinivorans]|uniref:Polyketide cyclase n=1 Tax=Comamonas serinivorans TaxID=1082851 RepID=A0A1Y0EMX1_9BURK|nr:SRPBCC family protein [Comamonas serinivorans]ARU04780.1 polyketide cyclase [Comamonas serinivorans]